MVADALVYHPAVAHYLRFVATTIGRDKALRTLQYFSRFYSWYLYRTNASAASIAPYDAIKKQFGLTRKILRVGKFVEHFKAAAVAADAKGMDPVLRALAVGRQLGYAWYLSLDAVTVIDGVGVKKLNSIKKIQELAFKGWFVGLACNLAAGLYTIWQLRQKALAVDKKEGEGAVEEKLIERERQATSIQLLMDFCDITVPASALGYANIDDGAVGLLGVTSSLIGVWSTWKKTA